MLTNEVKTEAVQQWLMDRLDQDLAISDWTSTEFSSALSIKLRRREIGEETKSWALSYFGFHKEQSFSVFSVSRQAFQKASLFAGRPSLNLRGSDALHLAICAEFKVDLVTLDKRMHKAALALDLSSVLI